MTKARIISLGQTLTREEARAPTSGSQETYLDIPEGIIRVTLIFDELSLNAAQRYYIQLGIATGLQTTGYDSMSQGNGGSNTSTISFVIRNTNTSNLTSGMMEIVNTTGFRWVSSHVFYNSHVNEIVYGGGNVTLTDELGQIRITRRNSGSFDGGRINLLFE